MPPKAKAKAAAKVPDDAADEDQARDESRANDSSNVVDDEDGNAADGSKSSANGIPGLGLPVGFGGKKALVFASKLRKKAKLQFGPQIPENAIWVDPRDPLLISLPETQLLSTLGAGPRVPPPTILSGYNLNDLLLHEKARSQEALNKDKINSETGILDDELFAMKMESQKEAVPFKNHHVSPSRYHLKTSSSGPMSIAQRLTHRLESVQQDGVGVLDSSHMSGAYDYCDIGLKSLNRQDHLLYFQMSELGLWLKRTLCMNLVPNRYLSSTETFVTRKWLMRKRGMNNFLRSLVHHNESIPKSADPQKSFLEAEFGVGDTMQINAKGKSEAKAAVGGPPGASVTEEGTPISFVINHDTCIQHLPEKDVESVLGNLNRVPASLKYQSTSDLTSGFTTDVVNQCQYQTLSLQPYSTAVRPFQLELSKHGIYPALRILTDHDKIRHTHRYFHLFTNWNEHLNEMVRNVLEETWADVFSNKIVLPNSRDEQTIWQLIYRFKKQDEGLGMGMVKKQKMLANKTYGAAKIEVIHERDGNYWERFRKWGGKYCLVNSEEEGEGGGRRFWSRWEKTEQEEEYAAF